MKIRVVTEYQNVDSEWLRWYRTDLRNRVSAEVRETIEHFQTHDYAEYRSDDPTSGVSAKTTYEVIREDADE